MDPNRELAILALNLYCDINIVLGDRPADDDAAYLGLMMELIINRMSTMPLNKRYRYIFSVLSRSFLKYDMNDCDREKLEPIWRMWRDSLQKINWEKQLCLQTD